MLVNLLGLPKQLEVLLIITAGITCLSFDSSLFHMKSNLEEIWSYDYHPKLQEYYVETMLKYTLTGVVFIRAFTTHIYLALYIVLLWPALFEDRPNLIVPWLVVGSVRSVAVNVVTLVTGSYVCITQKGHHPICFDYFVSQIIEHGPSLYAWLTIFSYYNTLQAYCYEKEKRASIEQEQAIRRRRAKYMDTSQISFDEKVDDGRNLLSESTLATLLYRLKKESSATVSRSLDSLLKLKSTRETKDEILYSDIFSDDEPTASILERAIKLLNIEDEYVIKAMRARALSKDTEASSISKYFSSEDELEYMAIDLNSVHTSTLLDVEESPKMPPTSPENEIEISSISLEATSKATPKTTSQDEKTTNEIDQVIEVIKTTVEKEKTITETEKPKPDFLEQVADVMQNEIKKMAHFGGQAGVLNRTILSRPAEEVKKKFRLSKRLILNSW